VVQQRTGAAPATPPAASRGEAPARHAPQPAPADPARETATATRVAASPENVPAFLKDVPTEQAKTLKCQECGTMNYATEWYCERCGGELAAM
jgi:hypothetical protein